MLTSLWLDGQEVSPGAHVVSGPISLTKAQTHVSIVSPQLTDFSSFTGSFNHPKCRPSHLIPEPEPVHTEHVHTISHLSDVPDFTTTYQVNVLVRSTPDTASLRDFLCMLLWAKFVPRPLLIVKFLNKLLLTQNVGDMWYHFAQQIPVNAMIMFIMTLIFPQESLLMLLQN